MESTFKNKVAVITGGSFGIGRATAISFAKKGAICVIADYVEDNETVNLIKSTGAEALFIKCDVSDEKQIKAMTETILSKYGRLDYAINNAGIEGQQKACQDFTEDEWNKIMDINVKGVWLGMKYQIPQMIKQGGGAIVNVSSIAGVVGFANIAHYVASKHAVIGLTKSAALENTKNNIRINVICPGVIKTPMVDRALGGSSDAEQAYKNVIPMGRFGTPEEMAETITFLCSDGAGYINGQSIIADGGWVTQ